MRPRPTRKQDERHEGKDEGDVLTAKLVSIVRLPARQRAAEEFDRRDCAAGDTAR